MDPADVAILMKNVDRESVEEDIVFIRANLVNLGPAIYYQFSVALYYKTIESLQIQKIVQRPIYF